MRAHNSSAVAPFSTTSRTRPIGHSPARKARTPSRSSSWSAVNSSSTAPQAIDYSYCSASSTSSRLVRQAGQAAASSTTMIPTVP